MRIKWILWLVAFDVLLALSQLADMVSSGTIGANLPTTARIIGLACCGCLIIENSYFKKGKIKKLFIYNTLLAVLVIRSIYLIFFV